MAARDDDVGDSASRGSAVALALIAIFSALPPLAETVAVAWGQWHGMTGKALRDGIDFWAGGFLALHHRLDVIFDPWAYRHFITGIFGPLPPHIWSYPPNDLLLAAAFGWLPPWPAVLAFDAMSLGLLALVLRLARCGKWFILAVILSPAAIANLAAGQNGILLAALIGGGLLLLDWRPRLAGTLIGLASIKPQLGMVLPLHLIRRAPRAFVWAALAAVGLAALSIVVFGITPWIAFWRITRPAMQHVLLTGQPKVFTGGLISVFAAARHFSLPGGVAGALAVQGMVTLAAVALAARTKEPAAVLILSAIASPYLHGYDLVGVTLAVALMVRERLANRFAPGEAMLFVAAWAGPGILVWLPWLTPAVPVLLALLAVSALTLSLSRRERELML